MKHLDKGMLKDWYGIFSGYSIALEAWRRGLTVTIDDSICSSFTVSISGEYSPGTAERTLRFKNTRPVDAASDRADRICKNKELTKEWLAKAGIPVPAGKSFDKDIPESDITKYAETLGFPVVLKPTDGEKGKGVIVNIKDEEELLHAIDYIRHELQYDNILLEKYITGCECRVLVVGDRVAGALRRIPANIKGNGRNTIKELIGIKNRQRRKNPCTSGALIKIDRQVIACINKAGYSVDSIPGPGEQIFLRDTSNVSAGGDPVDVTDEIPEAVKNNAVKAVKAIPGLYHAGVDVLIDSSKGDEDPGVIIEINSRPMISLHLFPVQGVPRDVTSEIVDLHFPETIAYKEKRQNDSLYFDRSVLKPIMSGMASAVTLNNLPVDKTRLCRILLTGPEDSSELEKWIKAHTVKLKLSGYLEKLQRGKVRLVLAGSKGELQGFIEMCKKEQRKGRIEAVAVKECKIPVFLGFRTLNDIKWQNL
jgi:D-alanine-D-alanine ligase-like ATP-grasp enzyme/acylphosphatase